MGTVTADRQKVAVPEYDPRLVVQKAKNDSLSKRDYVGRCIPCAMA